MKTGDLSVVETWSRIWNAGACARPPSVPTALAGVILTRGGPDCNAWERVEFFCGNPGGPGRGTKGAGKISGFFTMLHGFSRFCMVLHAGRPVFPRFPQISGGGAEFNHRWTQMHTDGTKTSNTERRREDFNREWPRMGTASLMKRAQMTGEAGHTGALARLNEVSVRLRPDVPGCARIRSLKIIFSVRAGSPSRRAPWGEGARL
jgi:hypothetical protein